MWNSGLLKRVGKMSYLRNGEKDGSVHVALPRIMTLSPPQPPAPFFFSASLRLGGLILDAGSSGSGQRRPRCSDPTASPGPGPLFQRPQGPAPCLPYLLQFMGAAMAAICEARRKADAVFPFVKSSFWKAFTTLMAIYSSGSVGVERERDTHTHTTSCMLTLQRRVVAKRADAATTAFKHLRTQPRPQSR